MHKPLGDRVIIKVVDSGDETTKSGIILQAGSKDFQVGDVVAVGPGLFTQTGDKIPMTVKVGDKVTFTPMTGQEMKIDGKDYRLFRESDFMTIV